MPEDRRRRLSETVDVDRPPLKQRRKSDGVPLEEKIETVGRAISSRNTLGGDAVTELLLKGLAPCVAGPQEHRHAFQNGIVMI